jgi:hypothetical protein
MRLSPNNFFHRPHTPHTMPAKRRGGGRRGHRGGSKVFRAAPVVASAILKRSAEHKKKHLTKVKATSRYIVDDDDDSDDEDKEFDQKKLWERIQGFVKDHEENQNQITISVKKMQQEAKLKYDRSSRASAGWRFLCFFTLYAAVMILQKNADLNEKVSSSLIDYLVTSQYPSAANTVGSEWPDQLSPGMRATGCFTDNCVIPTYLAKGFLDIMDVSDFWDWMELHFLDLIYKVAPQSFRELETVSD